MGLLDPAIAKQLISDQGEVVVDEVRKHWAAIGWAVVEAFGGFLVLVLTVFLPVQVWWLPSLIGLAIMAHAAMRIVEQRVDRFVITNMRVFRVHGILSRNIATMPLARILDISVHKPIVGRIFGYGHFVFESAAQEQGLREIRFVGRPDERGLTIQRVIAQAGLRGYAGRQAIEQGMMPAGEPPVERAQRVTTPPVPQTSAAEVASAYDRSSSRGWDWLAHAQQREEERLAELRRRQNTGLFVQSDPDRTDTAPIELPRDDRDH